MTFNQLNKSTIYMIIAAASMGLSGCVSTQDFEASQQRITQLNSELNSLQQQIVDLQAELAVVKEQRPIRLPTGTKLPDNQRVSSGASNSNAVENANQGTGDDEASLYQQALSMYQSGDTRGAIAAFETYNTRYPNATNLPNVLYYLGQASFVIRDYNRAEQVLEQLIYQYPMSQVDPRAPELLRRVYQSNGSETKLIELDNFLNTMNNPNPNPNPGSDNMSETPINGTPPLLN